MTPVHVNGRFTTQATTGVQRVARAVLEAVDMALASRENRVSSMLGVRLEMPPHTGGTASGTGNGGHKRDRT